MQSDVVVLCCCLLAIAAIAHEQPQQEPENERRLGLWFDQAISAGLPENRSLEFEFHQRLNEGASNLFEYFFQGGMAFRFAAVADAYTDLSLSALPGSSHYFF